MPFNPKSNYDMMLLREAIQDSRSKLQLFRERHREAVSEMAGVYYGSDQIKRANHLNMIELAITIYMTQLAARPPEVHIETFNQEIRPSGVKLQTLANQTLKTDLAPFRAIQRTIKDSLFSMGICKVGLEDKGETNVNGVQIRRQEPYIDNILLDDWVHDMSEQSIQRAHFMGHRYRMILEDAKAHPGFNRQARAVLEEQELSMTNEDGDERIHTVSQGYGHGQSKGQIYKMVELWDIWLPREKLLITYADRFFREHAGPLRIIKWDGPEKGPYHVLMFNEVSGNPFPLSPVMGWMGLHRIINSLYRKLDRQAERQKSVGIGLGRNSEDVETLRNASDGEIVGVDNIASLEEKKYGGIDQQNFAFMLQTKQLFSWIAGNLDTLGGLSTSSDTLGQDRILQSQSNQRIQQMKDEVYYFVRAVLSDFLFHIWHDPLITYPVTLQSGTEDSRETLLTPQQREHDFYEHQLMIQPHSMEYSTPRERLQQITQLMQGLILPLLPMAQQQGIEIDMEEFMRIIAKYGSLPELLRILKFSSGQPKLYPGEEGGKSSPVSANGQKPATEHVRRDSGAGMSDQGSEAALISRMMGGGDLNMAAFNSGSQ